jgi:hypothetical protein
MQQQACLSLLAKSNEHQLKKYEISQIINIYIYVTFHAFLQ